ncbi:MAG: pilus assembly protein PilM [Candidatus Omnitrophota bacterium]
MDIKNLFKKEYIIGLDIGSSSVKMAQFQSREKGFHFVRAELKEINHTGGGAPEKETLSALRYLLKGVDLKKSSVVAAINCPQTAIRKIITPYMSKRELAEGIKLEAKSYFPFPVDRSVLDFEILGDIVEGGIRKYEVMIAVSPDITVKKYLSLLAKAGIKPSSFVAGSYALYRFAGHAYRKSGETKCFIDIGEHNTELIIFRGHDPVFARKLPVAGIDFTKAIACPIVSDTCKIQLSMEDAEGVKRERGIPADSGNNAADNKISDTQLLSVLRQPVEQLAEEINKCFDYYLEQAGGGKIDHAVIFGGGASLGGLVKSLAEALGVEVRLGDIFDGIPSDIGSVSEKEKISYRLDIAAGAALNAGKGVNLLPPGVKDEMKMAVKRGTLEGVITAIIVISMLLYAGAKIQLNNFNKRITAAKLELSSMQPELMKYEAQALANRVLSEEPQWEDVLTELSNLIPDTIYLEELKMENNVLTIRGIVAHEDGEQILANFVLTLEKGLFNNVRLVSSSRIKEAVGVDFELRCWVDYENR